MIDPPPAGPRHRAAGGARPSIRMINEQAPFIVTPDGMKRAPAPFVNHEGSRADRRGILEDRNDDALLPVLIAGAAAGLAGSIVQAALGKAEELAFLPEWEDSNFAPRLMDRLAERTGHDLPTSAAWALGTVFHLGYGATWGALYAAARERRPVNPWIGGLALGGVIYAITFPRWGGAVHTDVERPPRRRSTAMGAVAASVTFGFGVSTALTYEAIRGAAAARDDPER